MGPWKDRKNRSRILPRTVGSPERVTRFGLCLLLLLSSDLIVCLSVCLVLSLRVSNP